MPSIQELETKVAVMSDMVAWIMNSGRVKIAVQEPPTGLLGPDGRTPVPTPPKIVECSMLEAYRLAQQMEK